MNKEEILKSLEIMLQTKPNVTYKEYWERIRELEKREDAAFSEEDKKLKMSDENLNKCFTIWF